MLRLDRRLLRACALFAISVGGATLFLTWLMGRSSGAMRALQGGFAGATCFLLNLLGNGTWVVEQTVRSGGFSIEVIPACTGVFVSAVFLSAVMAYPTRPIAKLVGASLGILSIACVNVIRLVTLFYIGTYLPGLLDVAHLVVWQSLVIVFALILWLLWVEKIARAPGKG